MLLVGAEAITRLANWTDRSTCVLFGDGAGAVVLQPSPRPGLRSSLLGVDEMGRSAPLTVTEGTSLL